MKTILEELTEAVSQGFLAAGYDPALGQVTQSNRPDLCQYQCNGAMAGAKQYHKAPLLIAQDVAQQLQDVPMLGNAEAVRPGFLNLTLADSWLAQRLEEMAADPRLGVEQVADPLTIVVDYGGPNVAKPLHVGHLRSAIIGESIKRTARFLGHNVIGDVHLGDWGLQIGQIITELKERQPELPYFDPDKTDDYPVDSPFTIADLEEIYPCASQKSKVDDDFRAAAQDATAQLQAGRPGYRALWRHIINISVEDLKRNYAKLNVSFDLWLGESDAQPYIASMVERMKAEGYTRVSDGALVVDVAEKGDKIEVPPCLILKSNGAAQYMTTDLATIVQRQQDFHPDRIIYLTDKRQALHFLRVFRCAYKTGLVERSRCSLEHIGFGTMNGKDGKPFKTREGGVLRLEYLLKEVADAVYEKSSSNASGNIPEDELRAIAEKVALAAIKYGDLSNQPSKDYVFDIDRFASFEGNTGPYIMYTMVRIKSILTKFAALYPDAAPGTIPSPASPSEVALALALCGFNTAVYEAYEQSAPNRLCHYIYELTGALNQFYGEHSVLKETDTGRRAGYVALIQLVLRVLETAIDLLGFEAPDRM